MDKKILTKITSRSSTYDGKAIQAVKGQKIIKRGYIYTNKKGKLKRKEVVLPTPTQDD